MGSELDDDCTPGVGESFWYTKETEWSGVRTSIHYATFEERKLLRGFFCHFLLGPKLTEVD